MVKKFRINIGLRKILKGRNDDEKQKRSQSNVSSDAEEFDKKQKHVVIASIVDLAAPAEIKSATPASTLKKSFAYAYNHVSKQTRAPISAAALVIPDKVAPIAAALSAAAAAATIADAPTTMRVSHSHSSSIQRNDGDEASSAQVAIDRNSSEKDLLSPSGTELVKQLDSRVLDLPTNAIAKTLKSSVSKVNEPFRRCHSSLYPQLTHSELFLTHSVEERYSTPYPMITEELHHDSPTCVMDYPPSEIIAPAVPSIASLPSISMEESREGHKSNQSVSLQDSLIPRNTNSMEDTSISHSNKPSLSFLELKKELEKDEFTKVVGVMKKKNSFETGLVKPSSQNSLERSQQVLHQRSSEEVPYERYDIIAVVSSVEDKTGLDQILGIIPASSSDSYHSSDGSSYSNDDLEGIDDITIDSTTLKLLDMHKKYNEEFQKNPNHIKSARKLSPEPPRELGDNNLKSTKCNNNKKLSWYDDAVNMDKPFTLRTDESFTGISLESTKDSVEIHGSNNNHSFILFAKLGLEKLLGNVSCGGEVDESSLEYDGSLKRSVYW